MKKRALIVVNLHYDFIQIHDYADASEGESFVLILHHSTLKLSHGP
jgi:hypothetical protein